MPVTARKPYGERRRASTSSCQRSQSRRNSVASGESALNCSLVTGVPSRREKAIVRSGCIQVSGGYGQKMTPQEMADLVRLRQARDRIDREYAEPLDVATLASTALMSPAHFSRKFRAAYGETPYTYLMTRRIERAQAFLRLGASVTDACLTVGFTSLGSFSSRFREVVGMTPTQYRELDHGDIEQMPSCISMFVTRPRRLPPLGKEGLSS